MPSFFTSPGSVRRPEIDRDVRTIACGRTGDNRTPSDLVGHRFLGLSFWYILEGFIRKPQVLPAELQFKTRGMIQPLFTSLDHLTAHRHIVMAERILDRSGQSRLNRKMKFSEFLLHIYFCRRGCSLLANRVSSLRKSVTLSIQ
jgi:hypothetical protein